MSQNVAVSKVDDADFIYVPPPSAATARTVLLKPNFGYTVGPPVTVRVSVVERVIEGIRAANPGAEIVIVEGVCNKLSARETLTKLGADKLLLLPGVRFEDCDSLPLTIFPNTNAIAYKYREMQAPALLRDADCRISIGAMKRTMLKDEVLMSCALKNLYGLLPRSVYHARSPNARGLLHRPDIHKIIADVYGTLGVLFDGAVVDAGEKFVSRDWEPDKGTAVPVGKILFGGDLLEVDRAACELAGEGMPAYLDRIREATESHILSSNQ